MLSFKKSKAAVVQLSGGTLALKVCRQFTSHTMVSCGLSAISHLTPSPWKCTCNKEEQGRGNQARQMRVKCAQHSSEDLNDIVCHKISPVCSETRYLYLCYGSALCLPETNISSTLFLFFLTKAEKEVIATS